MSTSRSPSNFFRSSRRGGGSATDHVLSNFHRRDNSDALLAVNSPQNSLQAPTALSSRSRSSTRSPSHASVQTSLRGIERLEKRRTMEERNFLQTKARAQNLNPPVDLRLLDYTSACDENLVCPICRCPFVDPVILNECDHCFCRDCIRQTWTTNPVYNPLGPRGDCPSCRTPAKLGPRSSTNKILINILDDLEVFCPKSDEGCTAKVKRGEVQDHMTIYCGYAIVECPADDCELPVRRKDAPQGCLHFDVSCLACREEMQKCHLETHWKSKCPDRTITCNPCQGQLLYGDLVEHNTRLCPAISIRCPGNKLGCSFRGKKEQADVHANTCLMAKLAPIINAQQGQLDAQEAVQKQMSRKLEVLEDGFAQMHSIMFPALDNPDQNSASPSSIPLLQDHDSNISDASPSEPAAIGLRNDMVPLRPNLWSANMDQLSGTAAGSPGSRPHDILQSFSGDVDFSSHFPTTATNAPYVSPFHHMLSMHESLREELSRINSALQELEGRHSMQILNETMRTREEITYMGAQIAGMNRQVHWLTSAELQRESRSATPGTAAGDMAAAGPSVEAAISSAVRGAARLVNATREGPMMRRRSSEEGRTKL